MDHKSGGFVWDTRKARSNLIKHGVGFPAATRAFDDPARKLYKDSAHSEAEPRWFCVGMVSGRVITVRFVFRPGLIRIIGAGFWRKGARSYEKKD